MNCDSVTKQLPFMLYGELTFDEEEAAQQHLDNCPTCQSELEAVKKLHRSFDNAENEVDPVLVADCRRNLRVAISAISAAGGPRRNFWTRWIPSRAGGGQVAWNWIGRPAGAVALVAIGFVSARWMPRDIAAPAQPAAVYSGDTGPVASRIRFVEPRDEGGVDIVLEETRQRILSGDMTDDGIRSLLVRAARESADPGVRVETLQLLRAQSGSQEVQRALLYALRNDTNPGVRLKALDALRSSASHPETREALAYVLLKDENPGVRTQAIDLLTQKHEPELVGVLQELMTREENNYVRMKCQRALNDMNASVETF